MIHTCIRFIKLLLLKLRKRVIVTLRQHMGYFSFIKIKIVARKLFQDILRENEDERPRHH